MTFAAVADQKAPASVSRSAPSLERDSQPRPIKMDLSAGSALTSETLPPSFNEIAHKASPTSLPNARKP